MFYDQKKAAVEIILGDFDGDVVLAASKMEDDVVDPPTFEILTMFRGLQLCANMGIQNIILENDCLHMVFEVQHCSTAFVSQRVPIQETRRLMQMFPTCTTHHVDRLGNEVAYRLARDARNVEDIEMWLEGVPTHISQAIYLINTLCNVFGLI
ncbi:uncharacterized protein LOC122276939 [Carya illinoinensis]|uniref:uncharacterized protein LOC122276939 n=1 Tax=Carya illinoinensis TaxID=32201 RepID=UPI001C721B2A|nr:uncharacterized protein LOC122276939 [Carya illinoinensis]